MSTALDLITRSLLDLKVLEENTAPSAIQASDGLTYLNDLLAGLSNEGLTIYHDTTDSFTPTGAASYTFGTGATWNSERPMSVDSAYYTLSGVDYPVNIINREQYEEISTKSTTGSVVESIYIDWNYPNATAYIYPLVSTGTVNISSKKQLTQFASTSTSVSFPVGYERMLRLNLAVELMPQYGIQDQLIMTLADKAKKDIKRTNAANNPIKTGLGLPVTNHRTFNIIRGY